MKLLKHILVVVALLFAAMPCVHARGHAEHAHDAATGAELCASHTCSCHSCDAAPCADAPEMPLQLTVASASASMPSSPIQLFIFTELKPVVRQIPPSVSGFLASLQTVQLLI
ncbi:hypothetical protein [Pontiella sulfatireligans]|uniref:Uncharacterized protein n=1 Tax=Pontiella sulfatireligans TaxID=2750658 RepID=A0A6C2UQF9_9BACT|nr:hypothetical protein [Pontiella sulfatireligans]VGO21537.1 hypothetical protein SCARR_03611 [Pontiella sulfatireligans]